jgi:TM2 domain-containing membrane protein YozV
MIFEPDWNHNREIIFIRPFFSEQYFPIPRNYSRRRDKQMREPIVAGILSLLIPGVGQIYNGRILIGIIWLVLTGVSWIGSAGLLGWVVHLISAWCAYSYAKENPVRA